MTNKIETAEPITYEEIREKMREIVDTQDGPPLSPFAFFDGKEWRPVNCAFILYENGMMIESTEKFESRQSLPPVLH